MKSISTYYCQTFDNKHTNFGDILSVNIMEKYKINCEYEPKINSSKLIGIGSLLNSMENNYKGYIWSSGYLLSDKSKKTIAHEPFAIRGKLSLKQLTFPDECRNCCIGDGGLLVSKVYPVKTTKKYKLGIVPHYVDSFWNSGIENFSIIKHPDVLLINTTLNVETYINYLNSCENILSSSLHGVITADSYEVNNALFQTPVSKLSLHVKKHSFKFKDYYSVYNMDFDTNIFNLNKDSTLEECLSQCKPFNKPYLSNIKFNLDKSLLNLYETIE